MNKAKVGYWKKNIKKLSSRIIDGKEFTPTIQQGYICSNCGLHEWSPKETCEGCGADMRKHEIDVR